MSLVTNQLKFSTAVGDTAVFYQFIDFSFQSFDFFFRPKNDDQEKYFYTSPLKIQN